MEMTLKRRESEISRMHYKGENSNGRVKENEIREIEKKIDEQKKGGERDKKKPRDRERKKWRVRVERLKKWSKQ